MSDDTDLEAELGFEPAARVTGRAPERTDSSSGAVARTAIRPRRRRGRMVRRLRAVAVLLIGLACMGGAYAGFATSSGAADPGPSAAAGHQLYQVTCLVCHGTSLQGVTGRGPSLIGVGAASVYFQVSTGRMPATQQGAEQLRKTAKFDEADTQALAEYVQSVGGGPQIPAGSLRNSNVSEGGNLYRLNCASCHGATGKGAPLSAGKTAPSLNAATDKQIYAAMESGPENMPVFSDTAIPPDQKKMIISYIQTLKASDDPGGSGVDRIGPVSEALVIWIGGVGVLMIAILWIGAKSQ